MDKINLEVKSRKEKGKKTKKFRKNGLIPGVVYGKGINNELIWTNALEFQKLLRSSGESVIINLNIDSKNKYDTIINELQYDAVSGDIIHIDFHRVRMDEKIETEVELVLIGEAPAVKELGGILVKTMEDLPIKCLPGDLPSHFDIDISALKTFDDRIHVKDLSVSKKIEIEVDPETVIVAVAPPRSEEELQNLETKVEEDVNKVEGVVKEESPEGKKEEAGKK